MKPSDVEDLLHLLSLVVLVDTKVYPEEVETMSNEAYALIKEHAPDIFLTKNTGSTWFAANREKLQEMLVGAQRPSTLKTAINRLSNMPDKTKVYYAMKRISHADNEFHITEQEFTKQAAYQWGVLHRA